MKDVSLDNTQPLVSDDLRSRNEVDVDELEALYVSTGMGETTVNENIPVSQNASIKEPDRKMVANANKSELRESDIKRREKAVSIVLTADDVSVNSPSSVLRDSDVKRREKAVSVVLTADEIGCPGGRVKDPTKAVNRGSRLALDSKQDDWEKADTQARSSGVKSTQSPSAETMSKRRAARDEQVIGECNLVGVDKASDLDMLKLEEQRSQLPTTPSNGNTTFADAKEEMSGTVEPVTSIDVDDQPVERATAAAEAISQASRPGAYSGAPGVPLARNDSLRVSQLGVEDPCQVLTLSYSQGLNHSNTIVDNATTEDVAGLMVAQPIEENSKSDLANAELLGDSDHISRESMRLEAEKQTTAILATLKWVACGALVITVVVLLLVLVLKKNDDDDSSGNSMDLNASKTSTPSASPTISLDAYILDLLPDFSKEAIQDATSPQSMAFQWLLSDPNLFMPTVYSEWRIGQRFSLATIYYATNGHNWFDNTFWMSYDEHECDWHSKQALEYVCLKCEDAEFLNFTNPCGPGFNSSDPSIAEGRYQELRLSNNGLIGILPEELYMLTELTLIQLLNNNLGGTISSRLGEMLDLERFDLSSNELSGNIPAEVAQLTSLDEFAVFRNSLTGTLPKELFRTNISALLMEENAFSGSIPSEIGLMRNAELVYLDYTSLTGAVPSEIGLLTELKELHLYANMISSSIPTEVGLMHSLYDLDWSENVMDSTIPTELGELSVNLEIIYLYYNFFTGTIPSEAGHISMLWLFDLEGNEMTGTLPTEIGDLSVLEDLYLQDNYFTGQIPSELGLVEGLWKLFLHGNMLTGTMPSELGLLWNVSEISFRSNQLFGPIPGEFGNMTFTIELDLGMNQLNSTIPAELGNMLELSRLKLDSNFLTGEVPSELPLLPWLEVLWLQDNDLSGSLPLSFELLAFNLSDFNITNNVLLSGVVPEELCSIDSLSFDCTSLLCGCDLCACMDFNGPNTTNASRSNWTFSSVQNSGGNGTKQLGQHHGQSP
ncbi:leucine rich repeat [Seminavis robusta]|uniref:non-specific serine/threonine protein kinase n=1 Tax=Seminavis robusta TaxID=568900 RepID=A0A9N8DUV8_9STRA|nr:leucine rich repeat [Seminavis robusta]|eukprot:Sro265_g102830.1 leucine rich repeat (1006) ;mRNA; f:47843-50955